MEESVQKIFESIPAEEPRSRLEPHRELILRLRRDGRTYRRIVQILDEKCGLRVTPSTLHEFVQRRSRPRKSEPEIAVQQPSTTEVIEAQPQPPGPAEERVVRSPNRRSPEEIAAMREAAKSSNHKPVFPREERKSEFVYDPNQPLTNKPTKE